MPKLGRSNLLLQIYTPSHLHAQSLFFKMVFGSIGKNRLEVVNHICSVFLSRWCFTLSSCCLRQCFSHTPQALTTPSTVHGTWLSHILIQSLLLQCVTTAAQETCTPTGRWLVSSWRIQCEYLQQSWDVHSVSMHVAYRVLPHLSSQKSKLGYTCLKEEEVSLKSDESSNVLPLQQCHATVFNKPTEETKSQPTSTLPELYFCPFFHRLPAWHRDRPQRCEGERGWISHITVYFDWTVQNAILKY